MSSHHPCVKKVINLQEREMGDRDTVLVASADHNLADNGDSASLKGSNFGHPGLLAEGRTPVVVQEDVFSAGSFLVYVAPLTGIGGTPLSCEQADSASASRLTAESSADADEVVSSKCEEESHRRPSIERNNSQTSSVTTELGLKLDHDDSCDWTGRVELDASTNTISQLMDSSYPCWTNDKHSSYLTSIEEKFVRNMYDREFCALDLCGQAPHHPEPSEQDCIELDPRPAQECASRSKKLKWWQCGEWQSVACSRPLLSQLPLISPSAVLVNPWIMRIRSTDSGKTNTGYHVTFPCSTDADEISKHKGERRKPQRMSGNSLREALPDSRQDLGVWQERLHSHLYTLNSSAGTKEDVTTLMRKDASHVVKGALKVFNFREKLVNMDTQMEELPTPKQVNAKGYQAFQSSLKTLQPLSHLTSVEPAKHNSSGASKFHFSSSKRKPQREYEGRFKMQRTSRDCQHVCSKKCFDQVVPQFCSDNAEGTADSADWPKK